MHINIHAVHELRTLRNLESYRMWPFYPLLQVMRQLIPQLFLNISSYRDHKKMRIHPSLLDVLQERQTTVATLANRLFSSPVVSRFVQNDDRQSTIIHRHCHSAIGNGFCSEYLWKESRESRNNSAAHECTGRLWGEEK